MENPVGINKKICQRYKKSASAMLADFYVHFSRDTVTEMIKKTKRLSKPNFSAILKITKAERDSAKRTAFNSPYIL